MENTTNTIYGDHLNRMEEIVKDMEKRIADLREKILNEQGMDPIEHYLARIKSDESMREKCRRNGLPETEESATILPHLFCIIGKIKGLKVL